MPALDGVRGIAVMMVLLGHISGSAAPYAANAGVTIFFVLSGFLITSLLQRELNTNGQIHFKAFYARRALRLYPALLSVIAITPILLWIAHDNRLQQYALSAVPAGLYYTDIVQASGHDLGFFAHTWSLSVEEQFYIVWPLSIWVITRLLRSRRKVVIAISVLAITALSWRVIATFTLPPLRVYFGPDTAAFALLLGCLLGVLPIELVRRTPKWVGIGALLVILIASVAAPRGTDIAHNWGALFAGILAPLVVASATRANRIFEIRLLRWFGTISYGIYLWHWIFLGIRWNGEELSGGMRVLAVAGAIVIAWLSYRYFESPILRLKSRFEVIHTTSEPSTRGHAGSPL